MIQFPIKLAFAVTSHKIQGATIPKPLKAIIDITDIFASAMAYVMLSRVCALWQIFILNRFDETKIYPSMTALKEKERLDAISQNKNPSDWEIEEAGTLKISSLNCRSLKKHYDDILEDILLSKSDMIALQETWLEEASLNEFEIPGYTLHLNSYGKGKGLAIYFKEDLFHHEIDIKEESMQLSKFSSPQLNIVVIYRSQNGNLTKLKHHLDEITTRNKPELIIGDFNFDYPSSSSNPTTTYLKDSCYKQLINEPTHI